MGTVVAQDIFQSKLDAIFICMEGVTGIADDMVIAGRDEMEHDRNFLAFVEKWMSNNLTLNAKKDSVQAVPSIFLWILLVKTRDFIGSKEDRGSESYGIPTGQGNYEIFPRDGELPQQVQCTQCTPCCTPQGTHTPGHRLQTK